MTDIVEDHFNGLLIPPANAPALEGAILRLADSQDLRESLGRAAQESVQRHTWERAARQLEALYLRTIHAENAELA